jgi:AcrR family transcriptional regulator
MAQPEATATSVYAGPAEERRAIARAARTVFARDGWRWTTTEAIAVQAAVDVHTVEHYFKDKEQLLLSVLLDSSASVAAALTLVAENHLAEVTDLYEDLRALGHDWLAPTGEFTEHFALVRHIHAEITHLPAGLVEMWQTAGPRQAQRELARRLERVADQGLLDIDDADRAAGRFIQLVVSGVVQKSFHGALPLTGFETEELVCEGVRDFIRPPRPPQSVAPAPGHHPARS